MQLYPLHQSSSSLSSSIAMLDIHVCGKVFYMFGFFRFLPPEPNPVVIAEKTQASDT